MNTIKTIGLALVVLFSSVHAAVVNATFNSATDVPVTAVWRGGVPHHSHHLD